MKKFILLTGVILFSFTSCEKVVEGCTDSAAINYSSDATEDDGTCLYSIIKRWYVSSMTLNNEEISNSGDFIEFYNDGSYWSYSYVGGSEIGTYFTTTNSITFTALEIDNQSVNITFTVNALMSSSTSLILSGTNPDGLPFQIYLYS